MPFVKIQRNFPVSLRALHYQEPLSCLRTYAGAYGQSRQNRPQSFPPAGDPTCATYLLIAPPRLRPMPTVRVGCHWNL